MSDTFIGSRVNLLGISYPFTDNELKHAFRELAFKCHPDKGGDPSEFMKVKEAYDSLLSFASESIEKKNGLIKTVEGGLLINLGKGLGDLTNSKDCLDCLGKGYKQVTHTEYLYTRVCYNCKGKGTVKVSRRKSVFSVNFWYDEVPCFICFGSGGLGRREIKKILCHTCYKCKGTGQIEILNPVLPKNRTTAKFKNKCKRIKKKYCKKCGALVKGTECWRCRGILC